MKKRTGLAREVAILPEEELRKMPTRQLLGRLQRLRFCEQSRHGSDLLEHEAHSSVGILFKDTAEWKAASEMVRRLLADREHVRRKPDKAVPGRSKGGRGR